MFRTTWHLIRSDATSSVQTDMAFQTKGKDHRALMTIYLCHRLGCPLYTQCSLSCYRLHIAVPYRDMFVRVLCWEVVRMIRHGSSCAIIVSVAKYAVLHELLPTDRMYDLRMHHQSDGRVNQGRAAS